MTAKGRHKADIKGALEKRGLTLSALDAANGLSAGTCSFALREPHAIGEQVIAEALGQTPAELWPNRYRQDGVRLRPQPAANYRTKSHAPSAANKRRKLATGRASAEHQHQVGS